VPFDFELPGADIQGHNDSTWISDCGCPSEEK